jgi:feruloyl-CoA synthase
LLRQRLQSALDAIAAHATGSSTYIARAMVLSEGPSAAAGELTDKGSINPRAFLTNRPSLLQQLFGPSDEAQIVIARRPSR